MFPKGVSCATILLIAIDEDFSSALENNSSIRLIAAAKASSEIVCLRHIDLLVGHWHLPDMPDGAMFKHVQAARPSLPLLALVSADDKKSGYCRPKYRR